MAQDIQNYLVDRPITAGPPSRVYQARKFMRRHRAALLAVVAVLAAGTLGVVVATLSFMRGIDRYSAQLTILPHRADTRADLSRWADAQSDFAASLQLQPKDPVMWHHLAVVQLAQDDLDGYRRTCVGLRQLYSREPSTEVLNWTCWTCILAPSPTSAEATEVLEMATKLAAVTPSVSANRTVLGAALYRAGRFGDAVREFTAAEAMPPASNAAPAGTATPYNHLFLAMAHHQLGDANEARRWLDRAASVEAMQPTKRPEGRTPTWNRRVPLDSLRREAQRLLAEPTEGTAR
jgi:Flp pilus assembly protein TadD